MNKMLIMSSILLFSACDDCSNRKKVKVKIVQEQKISWGVVAKCVLIKVASVVGVMVAAHFGSKAMGFKLKPWMMRELVKSV